MTVWVTDEELIERLGVPEKIARQALRVIDHEHRKNRFPQKQALWGNRRYWPGIKAWFDANNGFRIPPNRRDEDAA